MGAGQTITSILAERPGRILVNFQPEYYEPDNWSGWRMQTQRECDGIIFVCNVFGDTPDDCIRDWSWEGEFTRKD